MPHVILPVMPDAPKSTFTYGNIGRAGIGVSYIPLISILGEGAAVIDCIHLLTDIELIWQIRLGAELMRPEWTPTDNDPESPIRVDNDAVSIMGGQIVAAGLCAKTTNAGASTVILESHPVNLAWGTPATLCVRQLSGTGGIVSAVMTWSITDAT